EVAPSRIVSITGHTMEAPDRSGAVFSFGVAGLQGRNPDRAYRQSRREPDVAGKTLAYGHPTPNAVWNAMKSSTSRTPSPVKSAVLRSPIANATWNAMKSSTSSDPLPSTSAAQVSVASNRP